MDDFVKRKDTWEKAYKKFEDAGLNIYKPNKDHLYSTFLINTGNKCSKQIISELAEKGIYIGAKSACSLEDNKEGKIKGGEKGENIIRVSFRNPGEIDGIIISNIIDACL